jgi:hypothetical protein
VFYADQLAETKRAVNNFLSRPKVLGGGQKFHWPEVPGGAEGPVAGRSGRGRKFRGSGFRQEQKIADREFGRKNFGKNPNWKGGKEKLDGWEGGKARSTCYTRNSWINFNKTSSKPRNHKKIGRDIFVGIFKIGTKRSKTDEDIFTKYDDSACLSWKEILRLVDKYHKVNSFLIEHVTLIRKNFIPPKSWTFRITRTELMVSRAHGQEAMRKE